MVHTLKHGTLLIYDTEWTSWPGFQDSGWKQPGRYPEIIQIGAVKLDIADGFREIDAFLTYIRPKFNPELSDYIIELTGISQATLDEHGIPFPEALDAFVDYIGTDLTALLAFGTDGRMIAKNCDLNDVETPAVFETESNLRQSLLDLGLIDSAQSSSDLPRYFGLPDNEISHDALGDSRALANALRHLRATDKI